MKKVMIMVSSFALATMIGLPISRILQAENISSFQSNTVVPYSTAVVNDSASYIAAYTNPAVDTISLTGDITITAAIPAIVARTLTIEGNHFTLNYDLRSSTVNEGDPTAVFTMRNINFRNRGTGVDVIPHRINASGVKFIAENVDFQGSYFAYLPKGSIVFKGVIDVRQPTSTSPIAYAPSVTFEENVQFTGSSQSSVQFNSGLHPGPYLIHFKKGAMVTLNNRNSFVHTEGPNTRIVVDVDAHVVANIGSTFNVNDSLTSISVKENGTFDITTTLTSTARILEFQQAILVGKNARFTLKSASTGKLIRASRANAVINIDDDAEFSVESKGTTLFELTSPGSLLFLGQKTEVWASGSNTSLPATTTWDYAAANITFIGTLAGINSSDANFTSNFVPNTYNKVRLSPKRRPVATALPEVRYEIGTIKTEADFLTDINAMIDIQGVFATDFEKIVNTDVEGVYTVVVSATDQFGHGAIPLMIKVSVVNSTPTPIV